MWCDTPFTWYTTDRTFHDEDRFPFSKADRAVEEQKALPRNFRDQIKVFCALRGVSNIVLTGGEPLLQQKDMAEVMRQLREDTGFPAFTLEIETNGTVPLTPEFGALVDQVNCSPKLRNSGNTDARRLRPEALRSIAAHRNSIFKFVVQTEEDVADIFEVLALVPDFPADRVYLMPEGTTPESQQGEPLERVAEMARSNGFRVAQRVHIIDSGGGRGT